MGGKQTKNKDFLCTNGHWAATFYTKGPIKTSDGQNFKPEIMVLLQFHIDITYMLWFCSVSHTFTRK